MTFRVGMKVVCVDLDSGDGVWRDNDAPEIGAIYTITHMVIDLEGDLILFFAEIRHGPACVEHFGEEYAGYWSIRFRPVIERKADISIFTAMLTDEKVSA